MKPDQAKDKSKMELFLRRFFSYPVIRIALEIIIFLGTLVVLKSLLIKPGLGLLGLDENTFRAWQGIISIMAMFAVYVGVIRLCERRMPGELSPARLIRDGTAGILAGAAMISSIFLVLWLVGAWRIVSVGALEDMVVPAIWAVLLAAMEELIFRGIVYRILEEWLGTLIALALSAAIFGLLHLANDNANAINAISAISGGLLLGALYSITSRLWLPIFFHASWNLTQAIFGSTVSGSDLLGSYFESVREGPEWLTGGAPGIENSFLTIGLIVIVIGVLLTRMKQRNLIIASRGRRTKATSI